MTGEVTRLVHLFEANGVTAAPFKGPSLAIAAFDNVALFEDLDFWWSGEMCGTPNVLVKASYTDTTDIGNRRGFHRTAISSDTECRASDS